MRTSITRFLSCAALAISSIASSAHAVVTEFTNFVQWQSAAGMFSTITFAEFPSGIVTTQYSALGATFTDGNDRIVHGDFSPLDKSGLYSSPDGRITLSFSTPMTSIAAHWPGSLQVQLLSGGIPVFTSSEFWATTPSGYGGFAGLVSTLAFDGAIIKRPQSGGFSSQFVYIDNLYFGPPIPGPGAVALIGLAGAIPRRRRR